MMMKLIVLFVSYLKTRKQCLTTAHVSGNADLIVSGKTDGLDKGGIWSIKLWTLTVIFFLHFSNANKRWCEFGKISP